MVNKSFKQITKFAMVLIFLSGLSAQALDKQNIAINELRDVLEVASRSQQTVWVEDFTGLD
jgi:hypothetical protein|tara:strand:+ start:1291 stop:1473 length:183 start_codon:yes stop_codon:yes gene_type:complete